MVAGTPPSPVAGILAVLYAKIQNIFQSLSLEKIRESMASVKPAVSRPAHLRPIEEEA